jgi:hypothetical protein
LVVGVACLATSIYFFRASHQYRLPIFTVEPERTEIVSADRVRSAPIRVLTRAGSEITSDLFAVRFFFWNDGNLPIKTSDILDTLRINLADTGAAILDYRLLRVSRPLTALRLDPRRDADSAVRNLVVTFRILEPEDGLAGQIVYAGRRDAPVRLLGAIEGVKAIIDTPPRSTLGALGVSVVIGLLGLLAMVAVLYGLVKGLVTADTRWPRATNIVGNTFLVVVAVFMFLGFAYAFYQRSQMESPTQELPASLQTPQRP